MIRWISGFLGDARIAARGLARSPGFSAIAILTLALGLGGSAAIFTLLERVVLDPLPYPDSGRLVQLTNEVPGVGAETVWNMSTAQYVHFREHAVSLEEIALFRGFGANVQTPEGPRRVSGWYVTAGLFSLLGGRPLHGRLIGRADDAPAAPDVVVVSHGFWQREMGGDPQAVGRALSIDDRPVEVIGVLQPGLRIPGAPRTLEGDLWLAMRIDPNGSFGNNHVFPMIARLAPGAVPGAVETELERLTAALPERFPDAYSSEFFERYGFRTRVEPLKRAIVGGVSRGLWILFGAVGLVLVIAAVNVMNLFVVRMEDRQRELTIRSALGAGGSALASTVLAEAALLALAGGAGGLLIGFWGVPALGSIAPADLPRLHDPSIDGGTVLFTIALCALVAAGIAAYPLLRTRRLAVSRLAAGGRSSSSGRERQRLRAGLVVLQVGLALALVAGAGLLVESMRRLGSIDPGLEPEGVLTAGLFLTPSRYGDAVEMWRVYEAILERVRAIPGVDEVGMTAELPVLGRFGCTVQGFEDASVYDRLRDRGLTTCAGQEPTTPGYFEAAGIAVLRGRSFERADNDDPGRAAVIVSRAFADRFWPGEDPIGKGVAPNGRTVGPFHRVVGVVEDVPAGSLDGAPALAIYYPIVDDPRAPGNWYWFPSSMSLVVKTGLADPLSLLPQVRAAVEEVDPTLPLADARDMERVIAESTSRFRFTSLLLGLAAVMALVLAAVGLYGVVSYVVSRRTREIGIRIAVGARPAAVRRQVVRRALALVAVGLLVGIGLGLAGSRALEGLLYGVEPTHPGAFLAAAIILALVAWLASWIPARGAALVDPVEALRAE